MDIWKEIKDEIKGFASQINENEKDIIKEKFRGKSWYDMFLKSDQTNVDKEDYLKYCPGEFFFGAPDLFSDYECQGTTCEKCWEGEYIEYEQ